MLTTYLPSSGTYEKDLAINDEIDKLRLAAPPRLLSRAGKDVVVVSSVLMHMRHEESGRLLQQRH